MYFQLIARLQQARLNVEHWDRQSDWPTHRVRWFIAQFQRSTY